MPATSAKQARFMNAVAHNPEFATKVGVDQSVGKDFVAADKVAGATKAQGGPGFVKPHTENQKAFFKSKGFVPRGGIIEADGGKSYEHGAGSKTRPGF